MLLNTEQALEIQHVMEKVAPLQDFTATVHTYLADVHVSIFGGAVKLIAGTAGRFETYQTYADFYKAYSIG